MHITQGLRQAAKHNGQKTAVIDGNDRWTWSEFEKRVARLAGGFQSLGMKENDRVTILACNTHRQLEYFFGTIWGGGGGCTQEMLGTWMRINFYILLTASKI